MPEEIWSAAVEMARSAGPYATSKATRLNYRSLTERMGGRNTTPESATLPARTLEAVGAPAFIEVAMPPSRTEIVGKTVVEIEGIGKRLRIETTGALDVVGLVRAMWRDERCSN